MSAAEFTTAWREQDEDYEEENDGLARAETAAVGTIAAGADAAVNADKAALTGLSAAEQDAVTGLPAPGKDRPERDGPERDGADPAAKNDWQEPTLAAAEKTEHSLDEFLQDRRERIALDHAAVYRGDPSRGFCPENYQMNERRGEFGEYYGASYHQRSAVNGALAYILEKGSAPEPGLGDKAMSDFLADTPNLNQAAWKGIKEQLESQTYASPEAKAEFRQALLDQAFADDTAGAELRAVKHVYNPTPQQLALAELQNGHIKEAVNDFLTAPPGSAAEQFQLDRLTCLNAIAEHYKPIDANAGLDDLRQLYGNNFRSADLTYDPVPEQDDLMLRAALVVMLSDAHKETLAGLGYAPGAALHFPDAETRHYAGGADKGVDPPLPALRGLADDPAEQNPEAAALNAAIQDQFLKMYKDVHLWPGGRYYEAQKEAQGINDQYQQEHPPEKEPEPAIQAIPERSLWQRLTGARR